MLDDALRETPEGILVDVDVRPGAAETRLTGSNPWRRSLTVDVAAPPEGGAANRALVAFLARLGGGTVEVVRGATSRHKTVRFGGVSRSVLAAALAGAMP